MLIFPICALDHTGNSVSPCSPIMYAWTFLASISNSSDNAYLNLELSSTVPLPITLFLGNPDNLYVIYVNISTGFATTSNIAFGDFSASGGTKFLNLY